MAFVFDMTVNDVPLPKMLFITKQPDKTSYTSGEVFDPTGMEVSVTYTNGIVKQVTSYTYSPTTPLNDSTHEIIVSYTERGRTITATVPILVETILVSIAVTKQPNKTVYNYGETFNSAGMEVTAIFSNGSTQLVSGWTVDTTVLSTVGTQTITVSYTSAGATKTTTLTVTVNNVVIALPTQKGTLTYTGSAQSPSWNNYNTTQMTIGGTTSGINATSYTATFTPKYGYCWSDGSTTAKNAIWTIGKASISVVPSQKGSLTYTGSAQSPSWNNYNSTQLTIGGTTSGTNAGSYNATFTPTSNYKWSDGSTSKTVAWAIGKAVISTVPSQSGTLTYTGSSLSPTWSNYNSNQLTLGGTTSGTNAGSYTATFTPKANYMWNGGSTSAKSVNWVIGKAVPTVTTPPSLGTLTKEETFTITSNSGGTLTVSSGDTSIVNVMKVTNTTFRAIPVSSGTTFVVVKIGETANYKESVGINLAVEVSTFGEITDSWATISQRTTDGTAANYYAVGSYKTIHLQGYSGIYTHDYSNYELSYSDQTLQAFIIGIDHNPSHTKGFVMESTGQDASTKKLIHWQIGKQNNTQVTQYWTAYPTATKNGNPNPFAMNVSVSSTGEPPDTNSDFPNTMLFAFLNNGTVDSYSSDSDYTGYNGISFAFQRLLPNDLKQVLVRAGIDYYSYQYLQGGTMYASMILPSIIELFGSSFSSDPNYPYEKQYDYYVNGNSPLFYRHNDNGVPEYSVHKYWTRTRSDYYSRERFAVVDSDSSATRTVYEKRNMSLGICPIFFT